MKQWQLQEAKAKLSHLVKLAGSRGPQGISVRGKPEVVLLSQKTYENMVGKKPDFVKFMLSSPFHGVSLKIERDKSYPRKTIKL